jgi:two-component system, sensor histidine kinase and response regulator
MSDEPGPTAETAILPSNVRVLLVDDDRALCRQMAASLAMAGYQVVTAHDGDSAIAQAAETPPDVLVVDLGMPTSGLEVIRAVKHLHHSAVYVMVLTGSDEESSRAEAFAAGCDDYMVKPVMPAELKRRLAVATRTQRAFVTTRLAKEAAERRIVYGHEASALLAHDLNNGLAVSLSNLQFLIEVLTVDQDQGEALAAMLRSLRRMSGLVANFVDIARFEDAAVKPHCTLNHVKELIESVIEVHAVGCKVRVGVDCEPDLTGWFDVALIERVLHNLVGNAVRYCRADGEIRVSVNRFDVADPQSVEIVVFNNGPAIPPEVQANLFGKYSKGTNGKRGFGLYFCRLACEAHNGRIVYRGKSDGPSFVIRLPGKG